MDWFGASASLWKVSVTALGIYVAVILLMRLNGLRSFSSMSGFDFVITVATGSLIATTILNPKPTLAEGVVGIVSLFLLQHVVARLRRQGWFQGVVDNQPVLLLWQGSVRTDAMRAARITEADLLAKLREHGVVRIGDVEAVVLETTGKVSVIQGSGRDPVDPALLANVRR